MTVDTLEAIPAGTPLRCSFCWRTGRQIRVLAVGCEVNICDVCVRACSRRIAQHVPPDARAEYEALVVALALVDRGVSAEVGPVQAATRSVIRERLRELERNTPRGEPIVMTRVVEPGVAPEHDDAAAPDALPSPPETTAHDRPHPRHLRQRAHERPRRAALDATAERLAAIGPVRGPWTVATDVWEALDKAGERTGDVCLDARLLPGTYHEGKPGAPRSLVVTHAGQLPARQRLPTG